MKQNLPSLDLAYEASKGHYEMVAKWNDSLDNKIIAVFSVASLLIGILAAFKSVQAISSPTFYLAAVFFIVTASLCWKGFKPKTFMMGNNPKKLLEQYAPLNTNDAKWYLLKYSGENYEHNLSILRQKSSALKWAVSTAGIEVMLLLIWLITT